MEVERLIDAIVRQTMVLIAQLATTAGVRAPLAHIANQIFLDLVTELESHGVGQKVIADMFGLALRSYQQKVQRLSESATFRGVTLWEAVYQHIAERQVILRADILMRFRHDNEASVRGILNDLVESGLVYRTGRGDSTMYRVADDADMAHAQRDDRTEGDALLLWVAAYRGAPLPVADAREQLGLDDRRFEAALQRLTAEGRARVEGEGPARVIQADACLIPLGTAAGWEAALFDHYQSVVTAICVKLRNGATQALPSDQLGGSTFSFDVWRGHPYEAEVTGLLAQHRRACMDLWDRVHAHNQAHGKPTEGVTKVTFYCGQTLQRDTPEEHDP